MYSLNFRLINYSRSAYQLYSLPCVYISSSQYAAHIHREMARKSQRTKRQTSLKTPMKTPFLLSELEVFGSFTQKPPPPFPKAWLTVMVPSSERSDHLSMQTSTRLISVVERVLWLSPGARLGAPHQLKHAGCALRAARR